MNFKSISSLLGDSTFVRLLSIFLILCILGAIGGIIFLVNAPNANEIFTEFYILGRNNQADQYPSEFTIKNNQVTQVAYGDGTYNIDARLGTVTLGIVNHEQQEATYSLVIQIDGHQVQINYAGKNVNKIDGIILDPEAKWEQPVSFAPQHVGDNQKVEFLLYKDGGTEPYNTLHLWINVKG